MKEFQSFYDISPVVSSEWAVFPGDQAFEPRVQMSFEQGHHLHLSAFTASVHVGAHADAPLHYAQGEASADQLKLSPFIGPAHVFSVTTRSRSRIGINDFDLQSVRYKRVIFKTGSFDDYNQWNEEFMALDPSLIIELGKKGVELVGIDTPSVDLADSKDLPAHQALLITGMRVLEGLFLRDIAEGDYYLSALPLKLKGAEAAPVRALLFR